MANPMGYNQYKAGPGSGPRSVPLRHQIAAVKRGPAALAAMSRTMQKSSASQTRMPALRHRLK